MTAITIPRQPDLAVTTRAFPCVLRRRGVARQFLSPIDHRYYSYSRILIHQSTFGFLPTQLHAATVITRFRGNLGRRDLNYAHAANRTRIQVFMVRCLYEVTAIVS